MTISGVIFEKKKIPNRTFVMDIKTISDLNFMAPPYAYGSLRHIWNNVLYNKTMWRKLHMYYVAVEIISSCNSENMSY